MKDRINVFADDSALPLFIVSDAPATSCNYRCPYCVYFRTGKTVLPFSSYAATFDQWVTALRTALRRIRRPLYLCMGPEGEPLEAAEWWPVFAEALSHPHVRMAAFVSNLSRPIKPKLDGLDHSRIGVTGTLHPTQWPNKEEGLAFFTEQVMYLHASGVKVVLNYVLTPYQLEDYPEYKQYFEARGIPVTCNVFRGEHQGRTYPGAYDAQELATVRHHMRDIPYIFDYMSKLHSPLGNRCTASRYAINLRPDGSVRPCYFVADDLGSIFDDALWLYDENYTCSASECPCKWSIPLQEQYVREY